MSTAQNTVNITTREMQSKDETMAATGLMDLPIELVLRILKFAVVTSSKTQPIAIKEDRPLQTESGGRSSTTSKRSRHSTLVFKIQPYLSAKVTVRACFKKTMTKLVQPGITRTCRLLHSEGLPLFFKENVFRFSMRDNEATTIAVAWLRSLSMQNRAAVRVFCCWGVGFAFKSAWYRLTLVDLLRGVGKSMVRSNIGGKMGIKIEGEGNAIKMQKVGESWGFELGIKDASQSRVRDFTQVLDDLVASGNSGIDKLFYYNPKDTKQS
jgi:hypothetical protein